MAALDDQLDQISTNWSLLPVGLSTHLDSSAQGDATYMQFRELPFLKLQAVLVRPTRMLRLDSKPGRHIISFSFDLNVTQVQELSTKHCDVLLRFGDLVRFQPQKDNLPEPIGIMVNGLILPSGTVSGPVNITTQVLLQALERLPCLIELCWLPSFLTQSCFTVELVQRLSICEMFDRIRLQLRPRQLTQQLVDRQLGVDASPSSAHRYQSVNLLLICPLSLRRLRYPCRAQTCNHLDCFDGLTFLASAVDLMEWHCPVCLQPMLWEHIEIDEYFAEMINATQHQVDAVILETPIPGQLTPVTSDDTDSSDIDVEG